MARAGEKGGMGGWRLAERQLQEKIAEGRTGKK